MAAVAISRLPDFTAAMLRDNLPRLTAPQLALVDDLILRRAANAQNMARATSDMQAALRRGDVAAFRAAEAAAARLAEESRGLVVAIEAALAAFADGRELPAPF